MARKTNLDIYKAAQEKWDKANKPHETQDAFKLLYEEARLEWLKLKAKDFETTELVRKDLWPFIRKKEFGTTDKIFLDSVLPDRIFIRTKLTGDYVFECNGTRTTRNLTINPRAVDSDISQDPFNQPHDTEPVYYDDSEGKRTFMDILTPSTPQNVILRYVKYPEPYQLLDLPFGYTEEDEDQQNEIIDMAVEKHLAKIGDYQKMQAQAIELQKGI